MDGDERRGGKGRSLEPSEGMLVKYKVGLSATDRDPDDDRIGEPSEEETLNDDTAGRSMELRSTGMTEGTSSRDVTQSSMSMSEGEGDGDLEGMAGRVAELEELLQGKEAVVEALSAEIDHLRAEASSPNSSQSHNSSLQNRDVLLVYHTKLQDFERAVNQRDSLIHDLTTSLEQALAARDALKNQLQSMSSNDLVSPDMGNCTTAQERIMSLENALDEHKSMINRLNAELQRSHEHARQLEMEKVAQNAEINDYKTRVDQLNEQIRVGAVENTLNIAETLEMQKQYEARVDKIKKDMQVILEKFTAETNSKTVMHEKATKELETIYQRDLKEMKSKYEDQYKDLAHRYNHELPALETKHAKELSIFQTQLSSYKKTVETLKTELSNRSESQKSITFELNDLKERLSRNQRDKEMLNEQINLHKVQLDDLTSKYIAATAVLDSKESIERSLEEALTNVSMLKTENESLKFKYDDLSARYAAAQSLIENTQAQERSMSHRIYDLEKSLSRLSCASGSVISDFNETTYQTFDDAAIQIHATRQKLQEKMEMERQLTEKIRNLENEVSRTSDELNRANLEKDSYEKQLKDMKNTCDKLRSDVDSQKEKNSRIPQLFQSSQYFDNDNANSNDRQNDVVERYEIEMERLKELLRVEEKLNLENTNKLSEVMDKLRESKMECEQLKNGLANAWEQCQEFEEKLNRTLAMNETRYDDSLALSKTQSNPEESKNSYKTSNETFDRSPTNFSQLENKSNDPKISNEQIKIESLIQEISTLNNEKKSMSDEIKRLTEIEKKFEVLKKNFEDEKIKMEKLQMENKNLLDDVEKSSKIVSTVDSWRKNIAELSKEKFSLTKKLSNITDKHREELAAVKMDSTFEVEKLRNMLLTVRQDDNNLDELKNELELRHSREMEELRTYFEEKCLQMEKQYSEEIFSQQSKKMSDNDSEIDDLGDDLLFAGNSGGGGDCVNQTLASGENSRVEIYIDDGELKNNCNDVAIKVGSDIVGVVDQLCQTEWDSALENGELTKLRAAYSDQLEEQVALAKLDIVNALQEQIQALLSVESDMEDNWPSELIELRNKFTNNAKREIEDLKKVHAMELTQLKEENSRTVSRIIERHQEEMNKITAENFTRDKNTQSENYESLAVDANLIRERDSLVKTCVTLKGLIVDLIKYFDVCEEELNNTLITEVLKRQTSIAIESSQINIDEVASKNNDDTKDSKTPNDSPIRKIKRVHFAPQCSEITSMINSDSAIAQNLMEIENDVTKKLRCELDRCLKRLKSESSQIFGINLEPGESMLDVLSKQILRTTKINEQLTIKLSDAENLITGFNEETKILKMKIMSLQRNLMTVENKKEIVSEGYGEHEESGGELMIQDFSQLQEKARHAIMSGAGDSLYLLQLIEELCRHNDKFTDETKREKEDLQQQIEAADKQLRAIRKFLEEQASEREIERDDAARQIQALQDQVKEREREKERDLRITSESSLSPVSSPVARVFQATDINAAIEALESQMREMTSLVSDTRAKKSETESELKVAVDKIWVLRDIIVDLEQQIQARVEKEDALLGQIEQLEDVITAQTKNQQELAQELDAIKMGGENSQLNDHISLLEEELRKHKLSSEHFNVNSSVLNQMKLELRDMQNNLDKRTRELESLHMCGSSLSISQPSEDVSIRDQIDVARCPTPEDPNSPPTLPLDQLLKLKEKMLKHARAEEVALKRIKDLDMQLSTLKIQNEELQAEQEILQQTASEQLFQMEAMRGRLEQHKQSAPFAQRQATSRLELQLHEANAKIHILEQAIEDKELEMNEIKRQLVRSNQLLQDKQKEFTNVVQTENNAVQDLKDRLQRLEEEKKILESKVGVQERAQSELPRLIDSMLADKNDEIDHLKSQLTKRDKQLQQANQSSNNEDNNPTKNFEPKNSARTLSDILSLDSESDDFVEAIRDGSNVGQLLSHDISNFKVASNSCPQTKSTPRLSHVTPSKVNKPVVNVPTLELGSSQSPSLSTTCPRHSRVSLDLLQSDYDLKSPSSGDISELPTNNERFNCPNQNQLDCTCDNHENIQKFTKSPDTKQISVTSPKSNEKNLNLECQELSKKLKSLEDELIEKTTFLKKRENDLNVLQRNFDELRNEFKETYDTLVRDKDFYKNQYELTRDSETKIKRDLDEVENNLKLQTDELEEYRQMIQVNEKILTTMNEENSRLKQTIEGQLEINKTYEATLIEKSEEIKNLKQTISEKDIKIEELNTQNHEINNENKRLIDSKTNYDNYNDELLERENEIKRLSEGLNNRDKIIRRLEEMARRTSTSDSSSPGDNKDQEIHHLQEYLKEKEKVIRQMSDDSKSLHRALETIQNKMKESGNVVELRKKLKDERTFNGELKIMVEKLKKELETLKDESIRQSMEGADIEDMVQRELNLSARLDQQIMDVIESESEDPTSRRIEKHSCNSLTIKPVEHDRMEKVMEKYTMVKQRLKQANKTNEELTKIKEDLEIEREMLKAQLSEYESRIFQLTSDIEDRCKKINEMDDELSSKRNFVRTLEMQLQKEKNIVQLSRNHDSELISQLRQKLMGSLESEKKIRNDLTLLRRENKNLEIELNLTKSRIESQKIEVSSVPTDLLKAEQSRYVTAMEKLEKEERNNEELKDCLTRIESEKNRYESQLEIAIGEREKLESSLALAEGVKEHLEIDLKRTRDELKSREDECEWLHKRIKTIEETLAKRQRQTTNEQNELKSLRRGMSNAREVMIDLEADMKQSKAELAKATEERTELARWVENLTISEKECKRKLDRAKEDEERMKDVVKDLQGELQMSVKREFELTEELRKERSSIDKNVPAKFVQKIKELNESIEKLLHDKSVLHEKLLHARDGREQFATRIRDLENQLAQKNQESNTQAGHLTPHMAEKLQHFYGKYLRVDSRRKALVYQKRYLLCIVGGYQLSEENTLSMLAQLTHEQRLYTTSIANRKSPKVRFRTAALVIISIHRMKWMILRWRTGRRVGANAVLGNLDHSFVPLRRCASNHSPPVRERTTAGGNMVHGGFSLEHYLHRFMDIQQTLGLAMAEPESGPLISD